MKKYLATIFLCVSVIQYCSAQFPKTLPDDILDANVSLSFQFKNNESEKERLVFMSKCIETFVQLGVNVVYALDGENYTTESKKIALKALLDSLEVKYYICPVEGSLINAIAIFRVSDYKYKTYSERSSFQAVVQKFKLDVEKFKQQHPEADKVPFVYESIEENTDVDSTSDEIVFSNTVKYINELPSDLSTQTLLVQLYDDIDISKEDSASMSADEFARRKRKILSNRKKNEKFKEQLKEYPYPIKFIYRKDLFELAKTHPYELHDRLNKVRELEVGNKYGSDHSVRTVIKYYHNYCIKDHRLEDTYYRLPEWKDCGKQTLYGCLRAFVKSILKE
jgi:hypothetical protein